ncbi:MAG: pyridoxal phosphate-dependent aminotransferase [Deltaproteobacteria bacterium]|nr:pyridoxal phosphate-dependent aminotransferase [Deltaproteobacteria bacterium]
MPRLSSRALGFQESAIRKLDSYVVSRTDILFHRINIGQPDVATPPPILEAIHQWNPQVLAYGPSSGLQEVRDAVAAYHSRWSPGLSGAHVAITAGGSEAFLFAAVAACDPGDDILVLEPYYTNYSSLSALAGVNIRAVQTHLSKNFAIPSDEELDAALAPTTRAIAFANPGNPTGAVFPPAELERLLHWAVRHDLYVISDEVYRRIWFDSPPTSALEYDFATHHVICVDSMSKTWSACGLRVGFLISRNQGLMERVDRFGQARLGPQPMSQVATIAALQLPERWYEDTRLLYKQRMDVFLKAIRKIPGVSAFSPKGAFYTMLELPVEDTEEFALFLARDFAHQGESVIVAPAGGFYTVPERGRTKVRVAAVLEEARMVRAAELIGIALEQWRSR